MAGAVQLGAPISAPVAPAPATGTILAGSIITVRMIDSVDSSRNRPGEEFAATVDTPVMAGERVVIRKGSEARVRLVEAKRAGHFFGRSDLHLELVSIVVGGRQYGIGSGEYGVHGASRGKSTAERVGGGAALGGLIGALAGGGKGAAIGAGAGAGAGTAAQLMSHGEKVRIPSANEARLYPRRTCDDNALE